MLTFASVFLLTPLYCDLKCYTAAMGSTSLPSGASTECQACGHPRPRYGCGFRHSNLGSMFSMAQHGCVTCSILSDSIVKFLDDDDGCGISRDDVDKLVISFSMQKVRRSLEVLLLMTPVRLWFFCLECESQMQPRGGSLRCTDNADTG